MQHDKVLPKQKGRKGLLGNFGIETEASQNSFRCLKKFRDLYLIDDNCLFFGRDLCVLGKGRGGNSFKTSHSKTYIDIKHHNIKIRKT